MAFSSEVCKQKQMETLRIRNNIFNNQSLKIILAIFTNIIRIRSRDSIVGIVTSYRLDDLRVGVPVPVVSRIFSSPRRPHRH
jgi:hypothetical protein